MNLDRYKYLLIPLNRPHYIVNPELMQVALAVEEIGRTNTTIEENLVYQREAGDPKIIKLTRTKPGSFGAVSNALIDFRQSVAEYLEISKEEANVVSDAILESLTGLVAKNSKAVCSLPISLESALLQNVKGVTGKQNPADIAKSLNLLYGLGKKPNDNSTLSGVWWKTLAKRNETEFQKKVNRLVRDHLLPSETRKNLMSALTISEHQENQISAPSWLANNAHGSPFSWLAEAWQTLCSDAWVSALPTRRWSDWASCVLRTVTGLGYLWEMHFYSKLLDGLVDFSKEPMDVGRSALFPSSGLLVWNDALSVTARDVASYMKLLVRRGSAALDGVKTIVEKHPELRPSLYATNPNGLTEWITKTRAIIGESELLKFFDSLSTSQSGGWKNTYEAIRYALLCREKFGVSSDYYGLLEKRGQRFTITAPSSEWIVVIASLTSKVPSSTVRVDDLKAALFQLGLKPDYQTLIRQVELAGLGRGAHDADGAVEVATGF